MKEKKASKLKIKEGSKEIKSLSICEKTAYHIVLGSFKYLKEGCRKGEYADKKKYSIKM